MKNALVSVPAWCIFSLTLVLMLFSDASHSQARGGASGQTKGSQQGGRGVGTGTHGGGGDLGIRKGVEIGTWTTGTSNSTYDPTDNNIWDAMRQRGAGYVAETAWARKSQ